MYDMSWDHLSSHLSSFIARKLSDCYAKVIQKDPGINLKRHPLAKEGTISASIRITTTISFNKSNIFKYMSSLVLMEDTRKRTHSFERGKNQTTNFLLL